MVILGKNYSLKIIWIIVSCLVVIFLLITTSFVYEQKLNKSQPNIIATAVEQSLMLSLYTQGNKIIRSDTNEQIILEGVVSDYFRSDYNSGLGYQPVKNELQKLTKLKQYGINVVGLYLSNSPHIKSHMYILDTYINYANNNGLYVYFMPVARSFYNDPKRKYNLPPENYQDLTKLIDLLASRYKNYSNIIYGFGAEPGDGVMDFNSWNKKQIELANLVRKYNPNAPLLISAAPLSLEIRKYAIAPFPFNNVIYQNEIYLAGDEKSATTHLLNE